MDGVLNEDPPPACVTSDRHRTRMTLDGEERIVPEDRGHGARGTFPGYKFARRGEDGALRNMEPHWVASPEAAADSAID